MAIRFVLWDNDGVLVDTEEGYYLATRRALAEIGVALELANYHRLRAQGVTSWTLAEAAGIDPVTIDVSAGCATTTTSSSSVREISRSKACTTPSRR